MIVTACQHIPETVTAHAGSICPVALAAIGETDRMVCSAAWEAALHALTKIEVSISGVIPWTESKECFTGLLELCEHP